MQSSRAEFGRLVRLATPIILAQLSQMGQGAADAMMAGRVSAADLAGVTLGGNLYWPTMFLVAGITMAVSPSVSQLNGAGRASAAGEVVRQAMWVALAGGLLLVVLLNNAEPFYHWVGVDPLAIPIAAAYLHALSFSVIQLLLFFCLRYLCEGLSWTQPAMVIALCALGLKIALNAVFIHGGSFGPLVIPAMGGVGCGWASAVVIHFQLIAMAWVVASPRVKASGIYDRFSRPDFHAIARLVRLGLPIGLSMSLEMAVFSAVTLMIGTIGVQAVASHQIAMNVGGLAFMVPLALGSGAAIRVGFNVGAGQMAEARQSAWVAVRAAVVFSVLAALLVLAFRETIAGLYTLDGSVMQLAMELLLFVAVFQLFDSTQATTIGALRGYKDTATPMLVAIIAYWFVGFPVACGFGFGLLGLPQLDTPGFWVGLTIGLGVAAVALIMRLRWLAQRPDRILQLAGS